MEYLRPLSLIKAGADWWLAPLVFAGVQIVFLVLGLIPIVGILVSLVSIGFYVYLYGWLAEAQRAARANQPGLPPPGNGDYFLEGLRAAVVLFVWSLPMMVPFFLGIGLSIAVSRAVDPDVGSGMLIASMILSGLFALAWLPLPYIAMTRSNLARDWGTGFEVGAVFQTFRNAIVESYVGLIVWALVGLLMSFVGFLACIVGVYFVQPILLAAMGMFWTDVYTLAVDRGAPHVAGDMAPIDTYAQTFQ